MMHCNVVEGRGTSAHKQLVQQEAGLRPSARCARARALPPVRAIHSIHRSPSEVSPCVPLSVRHVQATMPSWGDGYTRLSLDDVATAAAGPSSRSSSRWEAVADAAATKATCPTSTSSQQLHSFAPPAAVTGRHHRRCRSQSAAAYYAHALSSAGPGHQPASWLHQQQHFVGSDHLSTIASASEQTMEDSIAAAVAQQQHHPLQHQQQHNHASVQQHVHHVPHQQQHHHHHRSSSVHSISGWQHAQRPCRVGGGRHQRSASLGLPTTGITGGAPGLSGGIGSWWTGPLTPGALAAAAAAAAVGGGGGGGATPQLGATPPTGLTSAGSFLHLGGWGGALGTLVTESLGTRRPSFCIDPTAAARQASSRAPSRAASSAGCLLPTCLICLDALTPEDFDSGEAITQACACKGDVALRHRRCAVQWSVVKRSTVCDVCRAPIVNLPDLPVEVAAGLAGGGADGGGPGPGGEGWDPLALGTPPGLADYMIDAVRVSWISLVLCILFFDMPVSRAFAIGGVVGVALTAAAHALVMAQRSAVAVRAFAAALRERAWVQGQQRQMQLASAVGRWGWGSSGSRGQDPAVGVGAGAGLMGGAVAGAGVEAAGGVVDDAGAAPPRPLSAVGEDAAGPSTSDRWSLGLSDGAGTSGGTVVLMEAAALGVGAAASGSAHHQRVPSSTVLLIREEEQEEEEQEEEEQEEEEEDGESRLLLAA